MKRAYIPAVTLLALVSIAGCRKDEAKEPAATAGGSDVDRAVAVYQGLQSHPGAADSVLSAHQLTPDGFDSLMFAIAADSAKSAAYAAAIR